MDHPLGLNEDEVMKMKVTEETPLLKSRNRWWPFVTRMVCLGSVAFVLAMLLLPFRTFPDTTEDGGRKKKSCHSDEVVSSPLSERMPSEPPARTVVVIADNDPWSLQALVDPLSFALAPARRQPELDIDVYVVGWGNDVLAYACSHNVRGVYVVDPTTFPADCNATFDVFIQDGEPNAAELWRQARGCGPLVEDPSVHLDVYAGCPSPPVELSTADCGVYGTVSRISSTMPPGGHRPPVLATWPRQALTALFDGGFTDLYDDNFSRLAAEAVNNS